MNESYPDSKRDTSPSPHGVVATETGRVCFVPDDSEVRGALAEFTTKLALRRSFEPCPVWIETSKLEQRPRNFDRIVVGGPQVDGMTNIGDILGESTVVTVADPTILYHASFGARWVRPTERLRAIAATNRGKRVGGVYLMDQGFCGVAVRTCSHGRRFQVLRHGLGHYELLALPEPDYEL
jgi:hypothetical protein